MNSKTAACILLFFLASCSNNTASDRNIVQLDSTSAKNENPYPTIAAVGLPEGYTRIKAGDSSFTSWLRAVQLKKDKAVHLYNGALKMSQSAQFAVLDISVSNKDLQQCADAVMRLRAEYLFTQKEFDHISFADNAEKEYLFCRPYTREHFDQYLEKVFGMCGSASLAKQLNAVNMTDLQPGDVLIHGGFPGHAVIVMDVAVDITGKKIFLLAQSYMPAQDIHLLNNPADKKLSPWYKVSDDENIPTPEYMFKRNDLKGWQ